MALLPCPECGKLISSHAVSCPECGYPMTKSVQVEPHCESDPTHIKVTAREQTANQIKLVPLENPEKSVPIPKTRYTIPPLLVLCGLLLMLVPLNMPTMSSTFLLVGFCVCFLGLTIWAFTYSINQEKVQKDLVRTKQVAQRNLEKWLKQNDISVSKWMMMFPTLVILSEERQWLVVDQAVLPFNSLLGCELMTDTITTSTKDGAIGRAVVGGVIAGGAGAIVGAAAAGSTQKTTLDIKGVSIYCDIISRPRVDIMGGAKECQDIYATVLAVIAQQKR